MANLVDLSPPSSTELVALQALVGQGKYGVVTRLAERHGLRRDQVYALREQARQGLREAFSRDESPERFTLELSPQDIARTVVALRVVTPASIRDEVAMLPIIYGFGWSYGKVWGVLNRAARNAAEFLDGVDLSGIESVALDEMFSQGRPVLAGIDLDTQYLFQLQVRRDRSSKTWAKSLGGLRDGQGLEPQQVVKDAGSGLAAGVRACWPDAEEPDDLFHVVRDLGRVSWQLEQRAYAAIAKEEETRAHRHKVYTFSIDRMKRSWASRSFYKAQRWATRTIERYDGFEELRREALRVLQLCDRGSGVLRCPTEVEETLTRVADELLPIGGRRIRKVATYLRNRAAGLGRYLGRLGERLDEVTEEAGGPAVRDAAIRAYQASLQVERGGPRWDRAARRLELQASVRDLVERTRETPDGLRRAVGAVFPVLEGRHRASSAIENFNAVLRPYLVVQKHAEQGFLDLFRFYWNTRTREWGRGKGTSAYEGLSGQKVDDWLSLLGFPPSRALAAAA